MSGGGEGGIPYHPRKRPLVIHYAAVPVFDPPLCRTRSGHYQTTTKPSEITCVDCRRLLPPLCDHCGQYHPDLSNGDPDGDPGCDWDAMSGEPQRNHGWHPADDPRHLTSDRIGFSVSDNLLD